MSVRRFGCVALVLLLAARAGAEAVRVELRVTVPAGTDPAAKLYVSGSVPALGPWKADAVALTRSAEDGAYVGTFSAERDAVVEFKITGGSWETVEKGAGGEEVANHRVTADRDGTVVRVAVASWASPPTTRPVAAASRPSTRTGDIRVHDHFRSAELGNERRLWVYLPPGYDRDTADRYPVLYMHDGQNLFDAATSFAGEWHADETAERLIKEGGIRPVIIVGVASNATRTDELTPTRDVKERAGGRGEAYARFLVEEVKPFVDRTYRTLPDREHTGVAGSSLGGLISLYIAGRYPDTFSRVGILSPSLWWDNGRLLKQVEMGDGAWLRHDSVWLDMGTAEDAQHPGRMVGLSRELAAAFEKAGLKRDADFRYVEAEGASHNEAAWAERFPEMLRFFFPK